MKWYTHLGDFANMVKAFIGSNYLGVSFAFYQSGLALGVIGLVFVALLTDHCCHLIVKTKYRAIKHKIAGLKVQAPGQHRNYLATSESEEATDSEIEIEYDEISEQEEHMKRHMSYGDVGWNAFGRSGLYVVNLFIAITQFGFCVGYFIFIGNTLYALFPIISCDNGNVHDNSSVRIYPFCKDIPFENINSINKTEIFKRDTGLFGTPFGKNTMTLNDTLSFDENGTSQIPTTTPISVTTRGTTTELIATTASNITNSSTMSPTTEADMSVISSIIQQSSAPSLKLLVASPLLIFIIFAMIRTIRKMSFISVLANLSIFTGCIAVFIYIVIDFSVHQDVKYFNWEGFPVFFGMLTAGFEGIGLVIPVESSMEGNRHHFGKFLHGAVFVLSVILGGFGVLGYLRFGSEVKQMLNTNIPASSWVAFAVNICVMVGVLLTFPLQIFPVTEMIEILLFSHGSICGPSHEDNSSDQEETLLPKDGPDLVKVIPKEVSTWKRNFVRLIVVCVACGLAVIFRDSFAYIGAFTGAVGSSLLAFILPCLFHLKICGREEGCLIMAKDVVIIIIGTVCSIISLYSVIVKLVHQTSV